MLNQSLEVPHKEHQPCEVSALAGVCAVKLGFSSGKSD